MCIRINAMRFCLYSCVCTCVCVFILPYRYLIEAYGSIYLC